MNKLEYITNHKGTKTQSNTKYESLSLEEEEIGKKVVNAANVPVIKNGIDRLIL
jgi:hypothetical protein